MKLLRLMKYRGHGTYVAIDPSRVESLDPESDGSFVRVHMQNGTVYPVAHTMQDVENAIAYATER